MPKPEPAAYLTIARIDGEPADLLGGYLQSSATMDEVGRDHGLVLHAAAQTDAGLLIVNLWPSRRGSEEAARDLRRLATIRRNGLGPDQIHHEHHDVARLVRFDKAPQHAASALA